MEYGKRIEIIFAAQISFTSNFSWLLLSLINTPIELLILITAKVNIKETKWKYQVCVLCATELKRILRL